MSQQKTHGYVITANDSVEAICLGTEEEAEAKKNKLKKEYDAWYRNMEGQPPPRMHWAVRKTPITPIVLMSGEKCVLITGEK